MIDQFAEKKLLYRVQVENDADAFGELYNRYIEKIYRFVFFKIGNRADAEDVTSDIFLKAWNYLRDKDRAPVEHFRGFIYQVARNTIIDWYRAGAKRAESALELAENLPMPGKSAEDLGPPAQSLGGHDLAEIFRAMKKMKHEYQEVILLRYIEEMSVGEIADITGKGPVNIRVTLHRAIKKLRELLNHV